MRLSFTVMTADEVLVRAKTAYETISKLQHDENVMFRHAVRAQISRRRSLFGLRKNVAGPTEAEVDAAIQRDRSSWLRYPSHRSETWRERAYELLRAAQSQPPDAIFLISTSDLANVLARWGNNEEVPT